MQKNKIPQDVPRTIAEHPDAATWKHNWRRMHRYNQMFSAVIVGPPGAGKSWLSIAIGELLDRTLEDVPRMNLKHVTFGATEFADVVKERMPAGTVVIIDDAGLTAYSREAMALAVRNISKIFQSIRFKNLCIILSLPSFLMLDKTIRRLINAYIEVTKVDRKTQTTYFKYMRIESSAYGDKVYRKYPVFMRKVRHPDGTLLTHRVKRTRFAMRKASDEILDAYEKKKERFMEQTYKQYADEIRGKAAKVSFSDVLEAVRGNVGRYQIGKGKERKVDWGLVLGDKELGLKSQIQAQKIAELINSATHT